MTALTNLTAIGILAALLTGCVNTETDPAPNLNHPRHAPGEVIVEIEDNVAQDQVDSLLVQLEIKKKGAFADSTIIIVEVPEGAEQAWVEQLDEERIVRSAQVNRFGDYYRHMEREGLPVLQGDSLRVWITYSGCGPGAPFSLEYARTGESSYELWLYKEPGTACAAVMGDKNRGFKIPDVVAGAKTVQLLKPEGGAITLKN